MAEKSLEEGLRELQGQTIMAAIKPGLTLEEAVETDDWLNAARALLLAVLEEAFEYDARHRHREVPAGCCRYHALRRRIGRLGKDVVE